MGQLWRVLAVEEGSPGMVGGAQVTDDTALGSLPSSRGQCVIGCHGGRTVNSK